MHVHSVSYLESRVVVCACYHLSPISHVNPLTLREVSRESLSTLGCVHNWRYQEGPCDDVLCGNIWQLSLVLAWVDSVSEVNGIEACAAAVANLEHASVQKSQVLHPVVHGLFNLIKVSLESEGLSSRSSRDLRVASQREESGELVPSEAKLLIKNIIFALISANVCA